MQVDKRVNVNLQPQNSVDPRTLASASAFHRPDLSNQTKTPALGCVATHFTPFHPSEKIWMTVNGQRLLSALLVIHPAT